MNEKKAKTEDSLNCRIGHTTLSENFILRYCLEKKCEECKFFLTETEAGIKQREVMKIPNQFF